MRIVPWLVAFCLAACGGGSSRQDAGAPPPDVAGRSDVPSARDLAEGATDVRAAGDAPAAPEVRPDADAPPVDTRPVADRQAVDAEPAGACAIVPPAFAALAPQRTLHVASGGSDTQADGSPGRPFATIERAARDATPGTAISVHAGNYAGDIWLENLRGMEMAPIWIGGANGEARPVIAGGSEGMHIANLAWVVLHDLEIRGASANGLNVDDGGDYADPLAAHHVLFQRLFIHDIGTTGNQDCLKLSGINDYVVLDSEFATCGDGGSAIDHVGCHRGLIARNRFRDSGSNAVQTKGGSEAIEIRANHIAGGGDRALNLGGSTGFEYFRPPLSTTTPNFEARHIDAFANVIEGSMAAIAFVGCVECTAGNNTIVDPSRWIVRILQETTSSGEYDFLPTSGGRFANNLVWYSRAALSAHVNVGPDTDAPSFSFSHNLWYAHDDPGRSSPSLPATEISGVVGQDPRFASGGYVLQAGSPAIGQGDTAWAPGGDFTGACYREPPAIGAYEGP